VCQQLVVGQWISSVTLDRLPREYHWPATSHWQTSSHNVVDYLENITDLPQVTDKLHHIMLYPASSDEVCHWSMAGQWYSLGSLSNIMWSVPATCSRSVDFFSYSIQHFVMFVSDLWQVYGCYLSILNNIMWSSLLVTYDRSDIFSLTCHRSVTNFIT
jgi:hypothetical protein